MSDSPTATKNALADKLHGMGDTAYCTASAMSKKDLCLGEEHKIKTGSFTLENLKALEAVRAKFGEANGLWTAAKIVRESDAQDFLHVEKARLVAALRECYSHLGWRPSEIPAHVAEGTRALLHEVGEEII